MKEAAFRKSSMFNTIKGRIWFSLISLLIVNFIIFSLMLVDYCSAENTCISNRPGSTQKICQLTGDFDLDPNFNQPTLNLTNTQYGVMGTDLGVSFEHNGKIYVLFGDTRTQKYSQQALDCFAHSSDSDPSNCLLLNFVTVPGDPTKFKPLQVPGRDSYLSGFEVPLEGISYNGWMYVYFSTDYSSSHTMGTSFLAKCRDDNPDPNSNYNFQYLYDLSSFYTIPNSGKFINVQVEVVENSDNEQYNGIRQLLPLEVQTHPVLLIWGSGEYRASDPYLAYMPLSDPNSMEVKSNIRYFTGLDGYGTPEWSPNESDAIPLFNHPCIGEFSVSWNPYLKKWLMLYNCEGIDFRVADYPWGSWSAMQVLFNPWDDQGYCRFMHEGNCSSPPECYYQDICDVNVNFDCLQSDDCGNTCCRWGGSYGPYVIRNFTTGIEDQETTIYFTLSTWNPYQAMLMKSTLEVITDEIPPVISNGPQILELGIPLSTNPADPTTVEEDHTVAWENTDEGCGIESVTWQYREYGSGGEWTSQDVGRWGSWSWCYPGQVLTSGVYEFRVVGTDGVENVTISDTYYISIGDRDGDGVTDSLDNCPCHYNPDQLDTDENGIGDACEDRKGDVNDNETIEVGDIQRIINIILEIPPSPTYCEFWAGDSNSDQTINVCDVQLAINKFLEQ